MAHAAMRPAVERNRRALPRAAAWSGQGGEFAASDELKKCHPADTDKHMRQGSASACRHVAPALLLC